MAPRATEHRSATILKFPERGGDRRKQRRLLRLAPEHDGLCILYSHHALSTQKLFALKILCWGLQADGQVVALFPWLNRLCRCSELDQPETGCWEGYYNPETGDIFDAPPEHRVLELEAAERYFERPGIRPNTVVQEVPDHIGSHAAMIDHDHHLTLHEVLSWRLLGSGDIQAMLPDYRRQQQTPVLPGDACLYAAQEQEDFRYFFQYHIANQIKSGDPVAVRALEQLLNT